MKEIRDPMATGNFEVKIDGELVHSKKTMGHDRCESAASTNRVLDLINDDAS